MLRIEDAPDNSSSRCRKRRGKARECEGEVSARLRLRRKRSGEGQLERLRRLESWLEENGGVLDTPIEEMTSLSLDGRHLTELPPDLHLLSRLKHLKLSWNRLRSIDGVEQMRGLRHLHLWHNRLTALPPKCLIAFERLEVLNVDNNFLTKLCPEIRYLINLHTLELNQNKLSSLPSEIRFLTQLEVLNVRENQLESLPEELPPSLTSLDLFHNMLTHLPDDFGALTSLRKLTLRFNRLRSLPPTFGNLVSLRILHVDQNYLTSLPKSISNLKYLQSMNLWHNRLKTLPWQIGRLPLLDDLYIGGGNCLDVDGDLNKMRWDGDGLIAYFKRAASAEENIQRDLTEVGLAKHLGEAIMKLGWGHP
mmetsp:Transcript_1562/g.2662  ORF Transcript_1562/g.2662 Transcript_1562/m.2662 type:complete len:364 (+) Transcript_1562:174-1265(+)